MGLKVRQHVVTEEPAVRDPIATRLRRRRRAMELHRPTDQRDRGQAFEVARRERSDGPLVDHDRTLDPPPARLEHAAVVHERLLDEEVGRKHGDGLVEVLDLDHVQRDVDHVAVGAAGRNVDPVPHPDQIPRGHDDVREHREQRVAEQDEEDRRRRAESGQEVERGHVEDHRHHQYQRRPVDEERPDGDVALERSGSVHRGQSRIDGVEEPARADDQLGPEEDEEGVDHAARPFTVGGVDSGKQIDDHADAKDRKHRGDARQDSGVDQILRLQPLRTVHQPIADERADHEEPEDQMKNPEEQQQRHRDDPDVQKGRGLERCKPVVQRLGDDLARFADRAFELGRDRLLLFHRCRRS